MGIVSKQEWTEKCVSVRLVVCDVDGTLTNGGMYYSAEGEVMKRFSAHDGMGLRLLLHFGIQVALMTSETTTFAAARARKLGIPHVLAGIEDKGQAIQELAVTVNISLADTLYIGDDINDLPAMRLCGVIACPSDAVYAIRRQAHFISEARGGHGAVREIAEMILAAQGKNTESSIVFSKIH